MKTLFVLFAFALAACGVTPAFAGTVPTTVEQQLAGCPLTVNYDNVPNTNVSVLDRTGLSRDCWRALNGDQRGGDSPSSDDASSDK